MSLGFFCGGIRLAGATDPFVQHRAARRQTLSRQIRRRYDAGWGLWPAWEWHGAPSKPSGLRRMWRWELSYRRITALFDLRRRKGATAGCERWYRGERPDAWLPGKRSREPGGSEPANGKRSHAAGPGPSNMFTLPLPCE
ncbi:hypothetical protein B7R77_24725 [Ralstonia solanacearum K60]|uniref:Uncharacterized protein n=1 Tax=Ralstonia solanacearum K60 TaxID=1091042 RepID=A0AAP7ZJC5_RALSL|nr:hypothetical protein B7R77_24725 [Ralstonia solanacearum K60]RIJ83896.1 hypothetical protein RSP822_23765 [Ralstonia solanacearum]